ncbi:MAG: hypothetical protein AB8G17_20695 [Gammaproteobacteria bacterium]
MRFSFLRGVAIAALLTGQAWAHADAHSADTAVLTKSSQTSVPLDEVLDVVAKLSQRRFAVDMDVRDSVELGRLKLNNIDYGDLLHILARNDLASFESGDITHIIREVNVRNHPLPLVTGEEANLHDAQWVTYVMSTGEYNAAQLLPKLRPLLPQSAHMAPLQDPNFLIVADRWQNVQRIKALVDALQSPANPN